MTSSPPPFRFTRAIVRVPAKSVTEGLRAHDGAGPNFDGVRREHAAYVAALRDAGVDVTVLPALEGFPDSVFVEDPALVFSEGAIVLKPGAPARAGEAVAIAPALRAAFDTVLELSEGTVEGGDVLTAADKVMIGLSARTSRAGAGALIRLLSELGRKGEIVETPKGVLHFKSDCSLLAEETVLSTARLAASGVFGGYEILITPEGEEGAANALRVNDVVFASASFPRTLELLDRSGFTVIPMQTREIALIDAGLSCMSLRWFA